MRLNASDRVLASVEIINVLARPGTPSRMQWPRLKSAISSSSMTWSWPTMTRPSCLRRLWNASPSLRTASRSPSARDWLSASWTVLICSLMVRDSWALKEGIVTTNNLRLRLALASAKRRIDSATGGSGQGMRQSWDSFMRQAEVSYRPLAALQRRQRQALALEHRQHVVVELHHA